VARLKAARRQPLCSNFATLAEEGALLVSPLSFLRKLARPVLPVLFGLIPLTPFALDRLFSPPRASRGTRPLSTRVYFFPLFGRDALFRRCAFSRGLPLLAFPFLLVGLFVLSLANVKFVMHRRVSPFARFFFFELLGSPSGPKAAPKAFSVLFSFRLSLCLSGLVFPKSSFVFSLTA